MKPAVVHDVFDSALLLGVCDKTALFAGMRRNVLSAELSAWSWL